MYNSACSAVLMKEISWRKSNTIIITIFGHLHKSDSGFNAIKKAAVQVYMPIILIIFLPKLMMF